MDDEEIRDIANEVITNPKIRKLIQKNHEELVKQKKELEFYEEIDILHSKLSLEDGLDLNTELLKINKALMDQYL